MAADIIDPILATCVAGLIGAVGHLWRANNKLGEKLDAMSRQLGELEGLAAAVEGCHVKNCPMREIFASRDGNDCPAPRRHRPATP